jgi:hypothetical protein
MVYIVVGIVAALVLAFVVFVAFQSEDFSISRSGSMAAPPAQVFPEVNDFHRWEAWSPWAKIDPAMKTTYTGPTSGEGASYAWSGNDKAGEGKMTITKSQPTHQINIQLEFFRPFRATNMVEFTLSPKDQGTLVSWTMNGKKNFFLKALHLFMNMDKMVGPDFEKGLAQLKTVVESAPQPR